MRFKYLFISLILFFSSCKKQEYGNLKKVFIENNTLKKEYTYKIIESDTLIDGYMKTYFENGEEKLFQEYKNGKEHGLINGYFDNGNIEFTGNYFKGKKDGEFHLYYNFNKPIEQKIKIKEKWFQGRLIHNKYEYDEKMNLKNYYFYNLSGEVYYYETYNENEEIVEKKGSKTPVIYSPNNPKSFKVKDTLQVIIFAPMSPKCQVKMSARIKGYDDEWEPLKINFRDNQIVFKKRINRSGEFRIEVKSNDSCDEKDYINAIDFTVNPDRAEI